MLPEGDSAKIEKTDRQDILDNRGFSDAGFHVVSSILENNAIRIIREVESVVL